MARLARLVTVVLHLLFLLGFEFLLILAIGEGQEIFHVENGECKVVSWQIGALSQLKAHRQEPRLQNLQAINRRVKNRQHLAFPHFDAVGQMLFVAETLFAARRL